MLIVKTIARLFEDILPLIQEYEKMGFIYIRNEDDGTVGKIGVNLCCTKCIYFDDLMKTVTYIDKIK